MAVIQDYSFRGDLLQSFRLLGLSYILSCTTYFITYFASFLPSSTLPILLGI